MKSVSPTEQNSFPFFKGEDLPFLIKSLLITKTNDKGKEKTSLKSKKLGEICSIKE